MVDSLYVHPFGCLFGRSAGVEQDKGGDKGNDKGNNKDKER